MSAGTLNLPIEQGATFFRQFTWQTGTPPTAVNLTGCTADAQIRDATGTLVLDLDSYITLGGTMGTITLTIPASVTATLTGKSLEWDMKITAADGVTVTRLLQGYVTVSAEVAA